MTGIDPLLPAPPAPLRAALKPSGLNGFIVPKASAFQNEYVPAYADRLAWLTGFDRVSFARLLVLELAPNYIW